jgi:stage V sporulation protein SpoVS
VANVSGAIVESGRDMGKVEIQTMGADSLYQVIKALILARGYRKDDGLDVVFSKKIIF